MDNEIKGTEKRILDAARKVFVEKGFAGSTMQEIADEAGINKSLLHYYFRTKERLFSAIFREAFGRFMPEVGKIFTAEISFFEKIKLLVEQYIDLLKDNPHIPGFILHELNRKPEKIVFLFKEIGIQPETFLSIFKQETEKGTIKDVDPHHFIVNLFSMCIFPFIAKPILDETILKSYNNDFNLFLEERKKEIPEFINQAIKK